MNERCKEKQEESKMQRDKKITEESPIAFVECLGWKDAQNPPRTSYAKVYHSGNKNKNYVRKDKNITF